MPEQQFEQENFLQQTFMGATYEQLLLGAVGGLLISLSSSLHLYIKGRVTGMSSILNGLLTLDKDSLHWKLSIFLGIYGHGVCGLPRFSIRSIVAVGTFFTTSLLTANLLHIFSENLTFLTNSSTNKQIGQVDFYDAQGQQNKFGGQPSPIFAITIFALSFIGIIGITLYKKATGNEITGKLHALDCIISFGVGILFACGLLVGGMAQRHVIIGFLTFTEEWNPTLLVLFMFAVLPNIGSFYHILKQSKPLLDVKFDISKLQEINASLVVGAAIFGIGWGIGGICPGPSFVLLPQFIVELVFYFFIPQCIGNLLATLLQKRL
ncbi:hypothetical protein PPERSA_04396 [Pseudocohnilembus persalinus]|uniref:Sulphur transport domain-containing protein n=1 Tax=Pseudocohnilembus persalinus TaxID=266149 RepID=A0A0V0QRH7_PSEPJ|nr:hypothetical protein PPERSA_04396 [Pseudocohnilembus persalinus]|eukprot:KRX04581.1 hypothetical protein PPERSA_04396 [Pseudocohnilembus persalinus]